MDLAAALQVFGLSDDPSPSELEDTYRRIRKPVLKELNKHDEGQEPPELVEKLDEMDTAFKVLRAALPDEPPEDGALGREHAQALSTGRVAFAKGDVLAGRFELIALLSKRPEGDTFRVRDRERDVTVALKIIDPALMADPRARGRSARGLLTASRLNHPCLARVLDVHRLQNTYAVSTQLPEGYECLWDLMYGPEENRARLTRELVLKMTEQAVRALAYFHRMRPHAALRPESIWVDADGNVKISDFGFSDVQDQLRRKRAMRDKLGTAYWAPEQYRDGVKLDARCDQYALALILYEILSGKPAVGRTEKIRGFRRDYPQRFTNAIERALSSQPERRYADMHAFGAAAFGEYAPEGALPAGLERESMLVPALVLTALFAVFAWSPFGRRAAEGIGASVDRWHTARQADEDADRERRRLVAMAARLHERREALPEASRAELDAVRAALAGPLVDADERARIQTDLTEIVRQLVATSRRGAETALGAATGALDALDERGTEALQSARERALQGALALEDPSAEDRFARLETYVTSRAAIERVRRGVRAADAAVWQGPDPAQALRALREAREAMAIGDETATGNAFDRAAEALGRLAAAAGTAAEGLADASAADAAAPANLEEEDRKALLGAFLRAGGPSSDDEDLARLADRLAANAFLAATAALLVHEDGYWTFRADVGGRLLTAGGTWRERDGERTITLEAIGGRVPARPFEIPATRGQDKPGLGDVKALLAAVPADASPNWSPTGAQGEPLPVPALAETVRTVRAGEVAIRGTLEGDGTTGLLVDGRLVEPKDGAFEATVALPGDALSRWVRIHAAAGMRSGPGLWMRLRADGIEPRVHLLAPADGSSLPAGEDVTVRVLVYDANLAALEVAGEARTVDREALYVLLELPVRTPARGSLKLPIRAVDAAGNEKRLDLEWPVR